MSAEVPRCPHCDETLPVVVDAFCPECRTPLDDAPVPRDHIADRIRFDQWKALAPLFMLGGGFAVAGGLVAFGFWMGGWGEQPFASGVTSVAVGIGLLTLGGNVGRKR